MGGPRPGSRAGPQDCGYADKAGSGKFGEFQIAADKIDATWCSGTQGDFPRLKTVGVPEHLGTQNVLPRLPGRKMNDRKDNTPTKGAPFGQTVPRSIADELNRYYKSLVQQELPDKIAALYQRFDELTKEKSQPETRTPKTRPAPEESK
jgi:hypothetical protein